MLSTISWSDFLSSLAWVLVLYYLSVLLLFYRKEAMAFIRNPFPGRRPEPSDADLPVDGTIHPDPRKKNTDRPNPTLSGGAPSFTLIHEFIEDLRKVFVVAARTRMIKEELVQAIRVKIKIHPGLAGSDLQHDLGQHIREEAKTRCGIDFDPDDLVRVWAP